MAVVLEQKIGNTLIRIHNDDYRDAAPEDVQRILARIADHVQEEAAAAEARAAETRESGSLDVGETS